MNGADSAPPSATASDPKWEPHLKEQSQDVDRVHDELQAWMRSQLGDPGLTIGALLPPAGTGIANETLLFAAHRTNGPHDGADEGYVVRLAAPDPLYLDYDLAIHYRMYETMARFDSVPSPAVVGYEADAGRLGAPFFVMERIEGDIPTDAPHWTEQGFVHDATPAQRHTLWENTVRVMARLHQVDAAPFDFLRTGATASGLGDSLDYWSRALVWGAPDGTLPVVETCAAWLTANLPAPVTALSWGDSRIPNVIYRDFTPVGVLDWDLVSLAGPLADVAWWIIMDDQGDFNLDGMGSADDLVDVWEDATGWKAAGLHWYLVYSTYRLAAIFSRLFGMMVVRGHMSEEDARAQIERGRLAQQMYGLLDITPPRGVQSRVPNVRL
ncbi:MAG: hypothetical protein JWL73_482 [Actinomycetia bacterium]|nr:hypothetical protein [Actinomycetes bacterium]